MLYQPTCVGLGYGLKLGLFPGSPSLPPQSNKRESLTAFVTTSRPGNINQVPIDYGSRPHLRGRLTLRGLTLRRNPWAFGDRVSHSVCRYSCQHSHFRCLQHASQHTFTGLRNAPLLLRDQKTDVRCQRCPLVALATCAAIPAASSLSLDIRLARLASNPHQYNQGPDNSGSTTASRPPTPAPSK